MKTYQCTLCKQVFQGHPRERRLEIRNTKDDKTDGIAKIGDCCTECGANELAGIRERRQREVIGPLNGEIVGTAIDKRKVEYVVYEKNGARFFLRADHEITRAVEAILAGLGPVELVSARVS